MTFSAMPTGDPRQSEIKMADLNPTDADLGLSPPTDESSATQHWTGLQSMGMWQMLCYIRRCFIIIVFDIILGVVDIGSDIISGTLFLNGGESAGNNSHC